LVFHGRDSALSSPIDGIGQGFVTLDMDTKVRLVAHQLGWPVSEACLHFVLFYGEIGKLIFAEF